MNDTSNRTTTYLLPVVAKEYSSLQKNKDKIICSYLGIKEITKELNKTFFLWVNSSEEFKNYSQSHTFGKDVVLEYDLKSENTQEHYDLFLKGYYSKFSNDNKVAILEYHNLKPNHKVSKILYLDPAYKKEMESKLKMSLKNYELGERVNAYEELYIPELSRD